jgi:hypothetical protein
MKKSPINQKAALEIKRQKAKGKGQKVGTLFLLFSFGSLRNFEKAKKQWLCLRMNFCLLLFDICLLICV